MEEVKFHVHHPEHISLLFLSSSNTEEYFHLFRGINK